MEIKNCNELKMHLNTGTYIKKTVPDNRLWKPTVDGYGNISWVKSESDVPPEVQNIKGEQGESGVYVGSDPIPEGYNVQIDPNGSADEFVMEAPKDGEYYVRKDGEWETVKSAQPFTWGANVYTVISSIYEQVYDLADMKARILMMRNYGLTNIWFPILIKPSRSDCLRIEALSGAERTAALDSVTFNTIPSYEYVDELIEYSENIGVAVQGIKIHNFWLYDNYQYFSNAQTFFTKYNAKCLEIAERYKTHIKYFVILDECYDICSDPNAETYIISLINGLQNKGLKSGLDGVIPTDAVSANVDILSVHRYPHISSKLQKTTYEDYIDAWKLSGLFEKIAEFHGRFPTVEIHVTEAGVQNYWESLAVPEKHLSANYPDGTPRSKSPNNEIQYMFFSALRDVLKRYPYVKSINSWFLDTSENYPLLKELFGGD